jgi:hypothetical protein
MGTMQECLKVSLEMNAFLYGTLILWVFWLLVLLFLRTKKLKRNLQEFWWASILCSSLGITEPLFVPDYWDPPSILKYYQWDVESFLFCFAVGGLAAVLTELPRLRRMLLEFDHLVRGIVRRVSAALKWLTGGALEVDAGSRVPVTHLMSKDQVQLENMVLVAFFVAAFGATSQLNLNIIYDVAIVSVATAIFIWWRRPKLRWQIWGGGLSFTLIYTVVLIIVGWVYPDFYDHWNHDELSGIWIAGAPLEEYIFAFTFGLFWAPLYEAWKDERSCPRY